MDIVTEVDAVKMTNLDVTNISLVEKPANKTPFVIFKSEGKSMRKGNFLNLAQLWVKKSETQGILAVVIHKDVNQEVVKSALTANSLTAEYMSEVGDLVVYKQQDVELPENSLTFGITPEVSVVLPPKDEVAKSDFDEKLSRYIWNPTISVSFDALYSSINDVFYADLTKEEAKKSVAENISKFSAFILNVVDAIPSNVFKLASDITKSQETPEPEQESSDVAKASETSETETETVIDKATVESTEEKVDVDAGTVEDTSTSEDPESAEVVEVEKSATLNNDSQILADLLKSVKDLTGVVDSVSTRIGQVEKSQGDLTTKLSSTLGYTESPDTITTEVEKSSGTYSGVVDTAFGGQI